MFTCESSLWRVTKKEGRRRAVELVADINEWSMLHGLEDAPADQARSSLGLKRSLLDYNEHFIELSNMGDEDRSLMLMLLGLLLLMSALPIYGLTLDLVSSQFNAASWFLVALFIGCFAFFRALWPFSIAPVFFTSLRPRYRFNRTTGKVYVLRPARYGGNVVLDWNRVKAHVDWCAPCKMTWDDLRDPVARKARQANGGGPMMIRGLVLYWPPFDANDMQRKGEEVLWVGPRFAGEGLWQYIRTFMQDGIDAVPTPQPGNWVRKGYSSSSEHLEEVQLGPSKALDEAAGRSGAMTAAVTVAQAPWSPLHALAERLCYWPTFPEEWNSDCGQKRRESGIGPEQPLRWVAKV